MNKLLLTSALAVVFGAAALAPQAARATDGTINITGTITSTTCVVNTGSPATIAVTLPTISTSALSTAGQLAGYTQFPITLSGCASGTKATTYFEQGPNTLANGNLLNNGTAGTDVQVRLFNSDQTTQVALNGAAGSQNSETITTDTSGAGTLNYWAAYYANAPVTTAGTVSTSVEFTMQYQ